MCFFIYSNPFLIDEIIYNDATEASERFITFSDI